MEELQRKICSKEVRCESQISVYQYLGLKLSRDKEFLLTLGEKDPSEFLASMRKVQYVDETIKSFCDLDFDI